MKVAIVHDWLTNPGGAERVVYELHKMYPDAPIYTSVYIPEALPEFKDATVVTSFLQYLPFNKKHQLWAWLRPFAFKSFNLRGYDLVISSSSAESKNVRTGVDTPHICYCHTPIRYYWSHYNEYKKDPGFGALNPLVRLAMPLMVWPLKWIDKRAAQKVDYFIANSNTVKDRIKKYYGRKATVIHPPADTERFKSSVEKNRSGFLVVGRQVPYKRIDLAVKACTELELPLTVIGNGSEHQKLREIAGPTITFKRHISDNEIVKYFHESEALIFPSEEDFGILPVEAMAAGLPVIAFGKGGARDSVTPKTGIFFEKQTVKSLSNALQGFKSAKFNKADLEARAEEFSNANFKHNIENYIESILNPR